jgi:hypothetical protein
MRTIQVAVTFKALIYYGNKSAGFARSNYRQGIDIYVPSSIPPIGFNNPKKWEKGILQSAYLPPPHLKSETSMSELKKSREGRNK